MPDCILPSPLRENGLLLLNQQCWHWGHDVRRAQSGEQSNALLEYGFTRCRPPEGCRAATMYSRALPSGHTVALWGFGIWFGDVHREGIYMNRFRFEPQWVSGASIRAGVWSIEQLAAARPSLSDLEIRQAYALVGAMAEWIAEYERWALEALGIAFRRVCVESYAGAGTPAERLPQDWTALAQMCRTEAGARFGSVPALPPLCAPDPVTSGRSLADCYKQRERFRQWLSGAGRKSQ